MGIWSQYSTRKRAALLAIPFLLVALLLFVLQHKPTEPEVSGEKAEIRLNTLISNEQSQHPVLDKAVEKFMQRWELKGGQLAVMRGDSLLYAKGYGLADEGVPMQAYRTLRVASVSKLVTAAAIMRMCEQGLLSLDSRVLGADGILNDSTLTAVIRDKRHFNITIEDLLRHEGGFSNRLGDPMFRALDFAAMNRLTQPPTSMQMCQIVLHRWLGFAPGSHQSYSNFGYLLLSLVIEKLSGMSYEEYVCSHVLEPAGCYDFYIAGNFYEQKRPSEVRYFMHGNTDWVPCFDLSGTSVERCYGGNNVTALSGAGAWCCSAPELMRFVASIDTLSRVPDIVGRQTVEEMVRNFDKDTYSLGWNDTHPQKGWTRSGSFSGTAALIQYFPEGDCWIFLTNTSTYKGHNFSRRISRFFQTARQKYLATMPKQDLFVPQN